MHKTEKMYHYNSKSILVNLELYQIRLFQHTMRTFLTNKGILVDNKTYLIHIGKTIDDEKQVVETLNHAYINNK